MEATTKQGIWQFDTLDQIITLLSSDSSVQGAVLKGSLAQDEAMVDAWSDIDISVVLADGTMEEYYNDIAWASAISEVFARDAHEEADYRVLRMQFVDGRQIDFVLIEEAALDRVEESAPRLLSNGRLLFSRSPTLDSFMARSFSPEDQVLKPSFDFPGLCNQFRFKVILALSKAARDERLVALHLGLDLIRDCLLLGMLLRDRLTGTTHHRDGTQGNHYIDAMVAASQPYTREGIIESIVQSAKAFDVLASQWYSEYQPCAEVVQTFADKVRG